jgi:hypothetical protein
MQQLLEEDLTPLRYLCAALQRRLEELPSTRNGLNRTENAALAAIAAGKVTLPDIFRFVSDAEEAPFLGDTMLYWKLAELAQAKQPVIQVTGPGPIPLWETAGDMKAWTLSLTDTGRALLTGTADWLRLNGAETSWRWSEQTRQVEMS